MAEYIEKQALIEGMVKVDGRKWSTKTLGEVLDTIGSIEIVRCKDCKYSREGIGFGDYECHASRLGLVYEADFFCADGKRKEDGRD